MRVIKGRDSQVKKQENVVSTDAPEPVYSTFNQRLVATLLDLLFSLLLIVPFFPQGQLPPELTTILEKHNQGTISDEHASQAVFMYLFYQGGLAHYISMRLTETLIMGVVVVVLWISNEATPGKMVLGMRIVDSKTGRKPTNWQYVVRYLGYFISALPLGLGFFWMLFNKRRRAWHDMLARTVVIVEPEHTLWAWLKRKSQKKRK
ncbi:MAG: RDD family protein [Hyphomicrobiales bacterium]|nr:RDD family protein [Rickettsiales bacterium]MCP5361829.1 RDD family protein [Hyphomicrobiales bacterium]